MRLLRSKKLVLLVVAVIIAVVGRTAIDMVTEQAATDEAPRIVTVKKGSVHHKLIGWGVIEANKTTTVYSSVEGEIIWIEEEGAEVKAGDPVVKFASEELEEELDDARRDLMEAEAELGRAKMDFVVEAKELSLQVKKAEVELKVAQWQLEDLTKRAAENLVKSLQADMKIALYQLENDQLEVDIIKTLKDKNIEASSSLQEKLIALKKSEINYQRAKELHEDAIGTPDPRKVAVAQKRVRDAQRYLERLKVNKEESIKVNEEEIKIHEANVAKTSDKVKTLEEKLDFFITRAPVDGTVVYVDVWKGSSEERSPIRVGESRWKNGDLLDIGDLSNLVVRVHVNEVDIRKVEIGQSAAIRLVAFPEEVYQGEVINIAQFADDKNIKLGRLALYKEGTAGVKTIDALIKLKEVSPNMRLGFTARVDIMIGEDRGLVVPLTAIECKDHRTICYLEDGGNPIPKEVTLGGANEFWAIVRDGLEEGDKIYDGTTSS